MSLFEGSAVAIITPFLGGGIHYELFETLVEWHIQEGTQAIIVAGSTGEGVTLSNVEKRTLFECAVRVAKGRVPIIANVGSQDTAASIALAKGARRLGVDGLLAVTPYYNKPNQAGMKAHFEAIASATNLPVILYNVPSRTGVNLAPETLAELALHPNIVGVKEAAGDLEQLKAYRALTPPSFKLYSGNDELYLKSLALGADGVISVVANLEPRNTQAVYTHFKRGQDAQAQRIQEALDRLNEVLYIAPNPVPVKAALAYAHLATEAVRLPLVPLSAEEKATLYTVLDALKFEVNGL